MKLKLDENLSRYLKTSLSKFYPDVTTVAEQGLLSQPDPVVAAAAKSEGRILLTLDIEFADLRKYPPGTHSGIILFRPRSFGPLEVNRFIENFIRDTDILTFAQCLAVVESSRIRIPRPPSE